MDCYGDWSDAIDIVTGLLPPKISPPTTLAVEKDGEWKVRVKWDQIVVGGEILEYIVKIKTRRPDIGYITSVQCDGTNVEVIRDAECYIDMSMFWQGTFLADKNSIIMATVSARNAKGQGPTSDKGGQQFVEYTPMEMHKPCGFRSDSKNIVNLEWDLECQMDQVPDDGGSNIEGYVMQFKKTSGANEQDVNDLLWNWLPDMGLTDTYMLKLYDHDLETVLDTDGEPWTGYMQYRMAAKNRWGPGPFCWPHLEIVDARAPERTNTPDSTIDPIDGDLKIEWETPNGNGLVVTSYEV
jgi:hypothetical protein